MTYNLPAEFISSTVSKVKILVLQTDLLLFAEKNQELKIHWFLNLQVGSDSAVSVLG